jgi:hypothetical protein
VKGQKMPKKIEPEDRNYVFEVRGGFANVDAKLEPLLGASGNIYGFKLPDGREADLAICLRVEGAYTPEEWIVDEKKMEELGFEGLDYAWSEFRHDED